MKYVIGHKNPDTDAIASAVSYAYLKNLLGEDCRPARLGPLNEETKYAIKKFGIEEPELITDARSKLKEIEIDEAIAVREDISCNKALTLVRGSHTRTLFVTEEDGTLKAIVSISDLTSIRFLDPHSRHQLLAQSPLSLIADDLKGEVTYASEDYHSTGRVRAYDPRERSDDYKDQIIVISNEDHLYRVLHEGPALVIYVSEERNERITGLFKDMDISLIVTPTSVEDILRIIYESVPVSLLMKTDVVSYSEEEYVDDIKNSIINTRFRCYPVVSEDGKLKGSISRYHLFNYKKKQFILTDHSSYVQSINNLKLAEISEIIDHHNIGNVETAVPIFYRNQLCGCTCSIVYQMYKENDLVPPKEIAGLMLSAIISDTLNFQSRTTTQLDKNYAKSLAEIAGVDLEDYANKLLAASVSLDNVDITDLLQRDLKQYKIGRYQIAVSQTNYSNIKDIQGRLNEFKEGVKNYQAEKGYDLQVMMFTSVNGEGSMFIAAGHLKQILFDIIEKRFDEDYGYDSKIMSRKQQLIPSLSKRLENL